MLKKSGKSGILFILLTLVILCLFLTACNRAEKDSREFQSLDDLAGCKLAISSGNSSYEPEIEKDLPGVSFDRYTNYFDTFLVVTNGNADAAFCFKYTFLHIKEIYPNIRYLESDYQIPIVANFSKDADDLREDFNAFIAESEQNGLMEDLAEKWLYSYGDLSEEDFVDFSDLSGNTQSFRFALNCANLPYEYLRNGKISGYEPALLYEFCKARGYRPEITESEYDAVVAGVSAGKYDMAMGSYGYTDERSENSHFSNPYFMDKIVYVIDGKADSESLPERISRGFERTFIRENRWKLFADGVLATLLITVFSVLLGSAAGFALFLLSQDRPRLTKLSYGINNTLESLPILVVLMLFFYVIFGKSSLSGVFVSIIVFALNFSFTFFTLISNSVSGISIEQKEAGLALGYSKWQTLFKIILPQAMESFIPSIRSAIVSTLKSTAIVGYVAVQDLTKSGDLVRSQTFEAFLPILTIGLLYFLLARVLVSLLNKLFVTPGERRKMRKEESK